ncbi:MAG: type II toxin-antitoxin system RelE family toxin [Thermoplasmata archaeon]
MTKFKIFVSTTASKELNDLEPKIKERIKDKLRELAMDLFNSKSRLVTKKLVGMKRTYYRLRVGDYRVIYFFKDEKIMVVRVATRSDVYPWLE